MMQEKLRTRLQKLDIRKWLNQKYSSSAKEIYKFLPSELNHRKELEQLFNQFDEDRSNALDFEEVLTMFNRHGFEITRKQLQRFFNIVDENKDQALNMDEFKHCMLDEDAKKCFTAIMKEVNQLIQDKQMQNINEETQQHPELIRMQPVSFQKIINLINYFISRSKVKEQLYEQPIIMQNQFKHLKSMITMSSVIEISSPKTKVTEKISFLEESKNFSRQSSEEKKTFEKDLEKLVSKARTEGMKEVHNLIKMKNSQFEGFQKNPTQKFMKLPQTEQLKKRKFITIQKLVKHSEIIPKYTFTNMNKNTFHAPDVQIADKIAQIFESKHIAQNSLGILNDKESIRVLKSRDQTINSPISPQANVSTKDKTDLMKLFGSSFSINRSAKVKSRQDGPKSPVAGVPDNRTTAVPQSRQTFNMTKTSNYTFLRVSSQPDYSNSLKKHLKQISSIDGRFPNVRGFGLNSFNIKEIKES